MLYTTLKLIYFKSIMEADLPEANKIPSAFVWRRLHSLTGFWLTAYLTIHLFTNSQAALSIGDDGKGFIKSVNSIHELPFLLVIEIAILAIPILIHMIWGIKYLRSAKYNSFGNTGHTPYLPEYPRNHRYTWQRITSWLLVLGIIAHIIHMRVIEYPLSILKGNQQVYMVRITEDAGINSLAERLGVSLYGSKQISELKQESTLSSPSAKQQTHWMNALEKRPLKENEIIAVANNFGTVELLMLRDTFKMPIMLALYTLFVLAACFHAFNGLWTFMISWGITLSAYSQILMRRLSTCLMILVAALGLSAIWLTYWINLKK
jgi:succinate dehydrogenase / fumarate reductase, cytochrome b subunit